MTPDVVVLPQGSRKPARLKMTVYFYKDPSLKYWLEKKAKQSEMDLTNYVLRILKEIKDKENASDF